jgi:hypothetical protein
MWSKYPFEFSDDLTEYVEKMLETGRDASVNSELLKYNLRFTSRELEKMNGSLTN